MSPFQTEAPQKKIPLFQSIHPMRCKRLDNNMYMFAAAAVPMFCIITSSSIEDAGVFPLVLFSIVTSSLLPSMLCSYDQIRVSFIWCAKTIKACEMGLGGGYS